MEQNKKLKRIFSPEQKLHILQAVESDLKNGMTLADSVKKQGVARSISSTWRKRYSVGVKHGLRNGSLPIDKEKKKLERENARLRETILSQAQTIADIKKETNWE